MMRLIWALVLLVMAHAASAQDGWQPLTTPGETGAANCAVSSDICLMVWCETGGPMRLSFFSNLPGLPSDQLQLNLTVDGAAVASTVGIMNGVSGSDTFDTIVDRVAMAGFPRAVMTGNQASFSLTYGGGTTEPRPVSLIGARAALGPVVAACPLGLDEAFIVQDPDQFIRDKLSAACVGQSGTTSDTFFDRRDLNGDGFDDIVIDLGAFSCNGQNKFLCTAKGCAQSVLLSRGTRGGFHLFAESVFTDITFGADTVTVFSDGTDCGLAAGETCQRTFGYDRATGRFLVQ